MPAFAQNLNQVPDRALFDFGGRQLYLGNSFMTTQSGLTVGTTETAVFLMSNPITNTQSAFLNQFIPILASNGTTIPGALFNFYSASTITSNGTALTILNSRINSSAPTTVMNAYYSPTVSANGTLMKTIPQAGYFFTEINPMIALDPGQTLMITAICSAATQKIGFSFNWLEI